MYTREQLQTLVYVDAANAISHVLAVQERAEALEKELATLRQRVRELESQRAVNSRNSGRPPSTGGLSKPAPKSLRKKTGRGAERAAPFPEGVGAPAQYGGRFPGFLACLRNRQMLPMERASKPCEDLFGHALSEGTPARAERLRFENLGDFGRALAGLAGGAGILHAGETGLRVDGKLHPILFHLANCHKQ